MRGLTQLVDVFLVNARSHTAGRKTAQHCYSCSADDARVHRGRATQRVLHSDIPGSGKKDQIRALTSG